MAIENANSEKLCKTRKMYFLFCKVR
jgi:hypothetical protein